MNTMEGLYRPNENLSYSIDLGDPGSPPFTRGIHSSMYRGKEFTMRQLTGFGSPSDTNKRIKYMLANGATGISVLFDFPTIQLRDSDSPLSSGHVGFSGVCVDTIEDMHTIFDGIDLSKYSIALVTHYPSNTAILFSMFLAMAGEKGYNVSGLRGSVQNDVTMEEVIRCGSDFIPPRPCFRLQNDNIEFIINNMPNWSPITLNGYNLRDAGTSDVTEMAVAISNGIETISELRSRGYDPSFVSSKIAFFWSIGNNFLNEVARLRAVRKLWCNILANTFSITDEKALKLKCHVQTSGVTLTRQEPHNNIIRAAYQALAAVFGGVQSLHVDSFDEAYSVPTEEAALLSLRTQQIIQTETGITDVVDPLGGSYYLEHLTLQYEALIKDKVSEISKLGGFISLVESGKLNAEMAEFAYKQQKDIESGKLKIIGVNKHPSSSPASITPFTYPEGVEENQIKSLQWIKATRDNRKLSNSLKALEKVCKSNSNTLLACIDCAQRRATKEEMFSVFKKSFGLWSKPLSV